MDSDEYVLNEMYDEKGLDEHGFQIHHSSKKKPRTKATMVFLVPAFLLILLVLATILGLIVLIFINEGTCKYADTSVSEGLTAVAGGDYIESILNSTLSDNTAHKVIELLNSKGYNCTVQQEEVSLALKNIMESVTNMQQIEMVSLIETMKNITNVVGYIANEQIDYFQNNTIAVNLIRQSSENTTQKLINIVSTLNNLKGISTSTAGVVDDILLVVEELLEIQNASVIPITCKDIKTVLPNSPTGYYHVNSHNIYCNMGELCGTGGGWTRLAYLDMSDSTVNCPFGFRLYQSGGVRACGRPVSSDASCSSVQYPSNGYYYSQICGRVVGYQFGNPDAVDGNNGHNNINSYYVDGVSITRGSPRQHVWTLMGGVFDERTGNGNCPCNTPPGFVQQVQSFVGSDYFCESGNHDTTQISKLYTGDPLWDRQGCGTHETVCCSAPGLPWFHRDYGNITTTDYIELRVCGDEPTTNEDVPVSFYEIYVK